MLKRIYVTLAVLIVSATVALAQGGAIKGKIVDKEKGDPISFASIIAESNGSQVAGATSDIDGNYTLKPLPAGKYDIKAVFMGYKPVQITGILVKGDQTSFQDIQMSSSIETKDLGVEIIAYTVPLIDRDNGDKQTIESDDIEKMPGRDLASVITTMAGVYSNHGEIGSIMGSRDDAAVTIVDGIKVRGTPNLPKSSIQEVSLISGGIPAQYGDLTSGVISVTTKGPSKNYAGDVELLTSNGLDKFDRNEMDFTLTGPLLLKKDKDDPTKTKPLFSFFLSGALTSQQDANPDVLGTYQPKDSVLRAISTNPIRINGTTVSQNAEYLTSNDFQHSDINNNNPFKTVALQGKIDVALPLNANLTFGGYYNYSYNALGITNNMLFNTSNNGIELSNSLQLYARFTQRFNNSTSDNDASKSAANVKNIYYSLQVGYTKDNTTSEDANSTNNFFDYGYVGKFTNHYVNTYSDSLTATGAHIKVRNGQKDTLISFVPGTVNPGLAAYTEEYYNLFPNDPIGHYQSRQDLLQYNIFTNGDNGGQSQFTQTYGLFNSVGMPSNGYLTTNDGTFSMIASGSADIKDHAIQAGVEFEQRNDKYYQVTDPAALWTQARLYVNSHLQQLDLANPIYVSSGKTLGNNDTIKYNFLNDAASQTLFDFNLRKKLGLPTNGDEWLDLDTYSPNQLNINMFSPDELLNGGGLNQLVKYSGYSATGEMLSSQPSFDDFFNKTMQIPGYSGPTVYARPIPAFQPNYVAGYVQDKFTIQDMIFNIGLRVDRFDANQQVPIDQYVLFPTSPAGSQAAKAVAATEGSQIPSNIGSNYVVYVNNSLDPTQIVGYRNGKQWYDQNGVAITDPTPLVQANGIQPLLLNNSDASAGANISSAAFTNYVPQVNFMPRVAFSFNITDEALFFANYNVLTQRPSGAYPGGSLPDQNIALNPADYYFIRNASSVIENPDLQPQKTISYEMGFQQKLNSTSSLKISGFYKDLRSNINEVRLVDAYPATYTTFGNIDFGTVKGLKIGYDLRRTSNLTLRLNYTLQFANGTGSDPSTNAFLIAAQQPSLLTTVPFNYDRRHSISGSVDFRFSDGKDYNGPIVAGRKILADAGVNFSYNLYSGDPYSIELPATNTGNINGPSTTPLLNGTINGSRLPWQSVINMRMDKDVPLKFGKGKRGDGKHPVNLNIYLEVLNLLNSENVTGVYSATGSPKDDGYLINPSAQAIIAAYNSSASFKDLYTMKVGTTVAGLSNYGAPRIIRIGMSFNF